MDTKHAFNTIGMHKTIGKDHELGKEVYELSERTIVSILMSWHNPNPPKTTSSLDQLVLRLAKEGGHLSSSRSLLSCQNNLAFHIHRLENHRRPRDSLRDPQCSIRAHPHKKPVSRSVRHSQPNTKSCILVLDQPFAFCNRQSTAAGGN